MDRHFQSDDESESHCGTAVSPTLKKVGWGCAKCVSVAYTHIHIYIGISEFRAPVLAHKWGTQEAHSQAVTNVQLESFSLSSCLTLSSSPVALHIASCRAKRVTRLRTQITARKQRKQARKVKWRWREEMRRKKKRKAGSTSNQTMTSLMPMATLTTMLMSVNSDNYDVLSVVAFAVVTPPHRAGQILSFKNHWLLPTLSASEVCGWLARH